MATGEFVLIRRAPGDTEFKKPHECQLLKKAAIQAGKDGDAQAWCAARVAAAKKVVRQHNNQVRPPLTLLP